MKRNWIKRRTAAVGVCLAGALVVIGCSSPVGEGDESSAGGAGESQRTTVADVAGEPSDPANPSSDDAPAASDLLTDLARQVADIEAVPSFADYAGLYGDAIPDPGVLAGKKLMIIPGTSALGACVHVAEAARVLAEEAGMQATIFENQGEVIERLQAVTQAINENYDAVIMECNFDPKTASNAITQAAEAGLAVVVYGAIQEDAASGKIDADGYVFDTFERDGKLAAARAIVDREGEPFHALAVTSETVPAGRVMIEALEAELRESCPDCTLSKIDVPVPRWSRDIQSAVTSELISRPEISVIFPAYDGMAPYVLAAIDGVDRTSDIKAYLNFSGDTLFAKMQVSSPGDEVFQSGVGASTVWRGYLLTLQVARILSGMDPLPADSAIAPNRAITPATAPDRLSDGGYGTDWVNGFRTLLGLEALEGDALLAAATLNGETIK